MNANEKEIHRLLVAIRVEEAMAKQLREAMIFTRKRITDLKIELASARRAEKAQP